MKNFSFKNIICRAFIFLFLILSFNQIQGQEINLSKKISINLSDATIKKIIKEFSDKANINFSYSSQSFDTTLTISFIVKNISVKEALNLFCRQTELSYKIIENQVVLKKKEIPNIINEKKKPETYTLSGFIIDNESGESLIGATVIIEGTTIGAITNSYGFYSITLPKNSYAVLFSYISYKSKKIEIELNHNIELFQKLESNNAILKEVTISYDEDIELLEKSQMSKVNLKPQDLNNMPEFAGETGLIKSLQTLPGIKTHSDGSSFFYARGGNKDQNLVLIDDAPVFNHAHLFGYYSAINPETAQDIKIYTGDMPVNQGDRISSVIDIHTKQGNINHFEAYGMINPLIYSLSTEGPLKKGKSSYYLSFRHSNFKWLYKKINPNLNLYLYDINSKINFRLNKNNRIYFTFYTGKDNMSVENQAESGGINWDNRATSFRWNHIFNKKLFLNSILYSSLYNYYLVMGKTIWNSEIQNSGIKFDFTWYLSPKNTSRFGYNLSLHRFNPGNLSFDDATVFFATVPPNQSSKNVFYFNNEYQISDKISLNLGLRLPIWTNIGNSTIYLFDENYQVEDTLVIESKKGYKTFVNFDPRMSFKYKLNNTSSLKLSYGIYHQYLQMLTNSISPFSSFEVWLPSGTNIKPQGASQLAFGFNKLWKNSGIQVTSELYYKKMTNQIDYEPHANLMLNPLIEGELRFGKAKSYGIEIMLKKSQGVFTGWISYTYSRSLKQINGLNNDNEFPAFYDRPHDFSIYLSYQITERTNISCNWIYYTGSAITTPISYYEYNGYNVPLYGDKNNDRLPDYHRLDLAVNVRLNKKPQRFQHSISLGIYNLYNRENPISINFNKVKTKNGQYVVPANLYGTHDIISSQKYLLGIMPSITYKFNI